MIEKEAKNQKRYLSIFNTAAKSGLDNEESDDSDKEDVNRNHYSLNHQGSSKHYNKT